MGDITKKKAAGANIIVGSDNDGKETDPIKGYDNTRDLAVGDLVDGAGVEGAITVGTTAVEAKVGGSALTGRKVLTIYNNGTALIYWGRTAGVTTASGTILHKKQMIILAFTESAPVYLIAGSAGHNVRITESRGDDT